MSAGYSGKPLWQKLGLAPGQTVHIRGYSGDYGVLAGLAVEQSVKPPYSFVHAFFHRASELEDWLIDGPGELENDAIFWASWPKKSSRLATDLDENKIRDAVLPTGLVDVKVCAVDDDWSALKFVVRKDLRADWPMRRRIE